MSYDASEKVLNLEDVIVQGATCLGVNPETNDKVMECQTKVKPVPKYNAQTGMWELKIDGTRIMLDY